MSGRMSLAPNATDDVLDGGIFCFTVELDTARRAVQYAVELLQASPRPLQIPGKPEEELIVRHVN
jgi:hypothetical protein